MALVCAFVAVSAGAADPAKVLRVALEAPDDGFDPVRTQNYYSHWVADALYERLLGYDYLARPAKLVPQAADALPQVSSDGKTYTFHLKKGIYFAPDPAFKGVRRELVAADFAYSLKRILDPAIRSQAANFLNGKIVGLDALAAEARQSGHFDYDKKVAGLNVPDRYTLRIELNAHDPNFLYAIAYGAFAAVAREVVESYGAQSGLHPVGTGPYMVEQYVPRSKVVLVANPAYRGFVWDFKPSADAGDAQLVREMQGKPMPQIGRIEISIIEEEQSRWLAFQDGQVDLDYLPQSLAAKALHGAALKPEFIQRGIKLSRFVEAEITYTYFNFRDPVTGGFGKAKNALRRAIAMSYNVQDEIELMHLGQAIKAEMSVPPGIVGHDPAYRSSLEYNIPLANKLLDRYGYRRGANGLRSMPDGSALVLKMRMKANAADKVRSEIWKRGLDRIGIQIVFETGNHADNLKEATACKLMMRPSAWLPDIPDGENFLQLLYGPNAAQGNYACYQSKAFDALYEKAVRLPIGPERHALYAQMNRQMEADTAWVMHTSRIRNWLQQPWVLGFKRHPVMPSTWQFMDIDKRTGR